jgi:MOSC domain-containing protein YiiM
MIAQPQTFELLEVRVGRPRIIGKDGRGRPIWSSINRRKVRGRHVYVTWAGTAGDQVTESRLRPEAGPGGETRFNQIHGGPNKAIYVYPSEHYARWLGELSETGSWRFLRRFRLDRLGIGRRSFGENWRVRGITEAQVHIGDAWQIGQVIVRVSRVRTPCTTLATYYGDKSIIKRMKGNGMCGWYLEVVQPGAMPTAGTIQVLEVHPEAQTVSELFAELMNTAGPAA